MELIIFVLVLTAIFAVKSVAILRGQDEEIAKSGENGDEIIYLWGFTYLSEN